MVTQVEIARRLKLDVSTVNKILNHRAGAVFQKETIKRVFQVARKLGYDFGRLKHTHRRRDERSEVVIGAEVILHTKDGGIFDQGVATIRDLSPSGARITDLATPMGAIPTESFTVTLRPMQQPLTEVELPGRIVRIHINGTTSYGIEFAGLDSEVARKLRRVTT